MQKPALDPIDRLLTPFQRFARMEAAGGIMLMAATVAALIWANSALASTYAKVWFAPLTVALHGFELSKPLILWINDGLMAVFFFVVGLEIKRELLVGEFAEARNALLPVAAALGGMVVPALLFWLLNPEGETTAGWGIPMATDIAFALAVLALLGKRVPTALKVFLTAVAIVDDIGAILVIAVFYTASIEWAMLLAGLALLVVLFAMNRLGVRQPLAYALIGSLVWLAMLKSGVHATVAGVLVAFSIPARTRMDCVQFTATAQRLLNRFAAACPSAEGGFMTRKQQRALDKLKRAAHDAHQPLLELEHGLHPWVSFFILPLFALANAGVNLGGDLGQALTHPLGLGIGLGLVLGKPLGVTLGAWLVLALKAAPLPESVTLKHILGAGCLAGIGFTMSIFVAGLAFAEGSELESLAKIGILAASLISGAIGYFILRTRA